MHESNSMTAGAKQQEYLHWSDRQNFDFELVSAMQVRFKFGTRWAETTTFEVRIETTGGWWVGSWRQRSFDCAKYRQPIWMLSTSIIDLKNCRLFKRVVLTCVAVSWLIELWNVVVKLRLAGRWCFIMNSTSRTWLWEAHSIHYAEQTKHSNH